MVGNIVLVRGRLGLLFVFGVVCITMSWVNAISALWGCVSNDKLE